MCIRLKSQGQNVQGQGLFSLGQGNAKDLAVKVKANAKAKDLACKARAMDILTNLWFNWDK